MSHHQRPACVITVSVLDTPPTAPRSRLFRQGDGKIPVTSANGSGLRSGCSTLPDSSLVSQAIVGAVVTENTDTLWATKSGWTAKVSAV